MKVTVPMPLTNKANTYEVHFDLTFYKAIKDIIFGFRKYTHKPLYWVAPSKEAKEVELAIAYIAKQSISDDTDKPVKVEIWLSNKLDADAIKAVLDGIQKSGRIKNDRQVEELAVHKIPIKNVEFSFDVTLI